MKLLLHTFELPLRHRFTIARESTEVQPTLIVELRQDGFSGFGEATTNSYYGATVETMSAALRSIEQDLESVSCDDPEALWDALDDRLHQNRFAQCALDQAAHDLWGKRKGKPVHELWGLDLAELPRSNYTLGIDTIDKMAEKMAEFPDWPIYKIKLGTAHDLEIVRQLRKLTQATFRVDANCGWSAEETIENSRQLCDLGVEFIEQPMPAEKGDEMRRVKSESALPLIADESCQQLEDVDKCRDGFHGINIKLVKCGGLTPARRMIDLARQSDLRVMVGCMTESSVGISAIAQLLPLLDYVDMDGATLLAKDIASGVRLRQGRCEFPATPGCGVELTG